MALVCRSSVRVVWFVAWFVAAAGGCSGSVREDTPNTSSGEDTDGDSVYDIADNCVREPNADQLDSDGDGLGDACDATPQLCDSFGGDADGDGWCNWIDNCPGMSNADQADADGDGVGDACEPPPGACSGAGGDDDGDGVCGVDDNCPLRANADQLDSDADGYGDACDPGDWDACAGQGGDADYDNWCAAIDNCPTTTNPGQGDVDGDGVGDACDVEECDGIDSDGDGVADNGFPDSDGDGVADCVDECPEVVNVDSDGDSVADCADDCPNDPDNDIDNDGVCGDVDNCPMVSNNGWSNPQADTDDDGIGDACDIEECDGIDNDGDGNPDDGLPDEDADGVCDEIDPCPADPINDPDNDGVCGMEDNCPNEANSEQIDSDIDGWGDACDIDNPANCDDSAPLLATGAEALDAAVAANDMAAHGNTIYLVTESTSPQYPNSVIAYDAPNASILWATYVGADPNTLAVSRDGEVVYVGLKPANQVRMVNVATRSACTTFPVGTDTWGDPVYAGIIQAVPGDSMTVLISTRRKGVSPDYGGNFVYDNGIRRPLGTPAHTGPREMVMTPDGTAYGYNSQHTGFYFYSLEIAPDGVSATQHGSIFGGFYTKLAYGAGYVLTTGGHVVDGPNAQIVGQTDGVGPVAGDDDYNEIYYATSSNQVEVYDALTFLFIESAVISNVGQPFRLVRWGTSGLAVLGDGGWAVIDGVAGP